MARRTAKVALPGSFTEKWPSRTPEDGSYAAEDVCTVTRLEGGGFLVKHYPDEAAKAPCCELRVDVTDADRVGAGSPVDAEMNALHRGNRTIDQKHGRGAPAEGAAA
jgi:hypothetical protein